MKIKDVAEALERFAPLPLQESYDNAGLQIGLTGSEDVSGLLLCLDVTEKVIEEAESKGCNVIVSHHPLIFRPLYRLTGQTQVERCVMMAIRKNIAIYSAHTNLDNAPGGVNFMIAEKLGLTSVEFLQSIKGGEGGSGIIGMMPGKDVAAHDFMQTLVDVFHVDGLMHNAFPHDRYIRKVALCGGAGDFLLDEALAQQADAFITGEMSYHRYFGHEDDLLIAVMGHYQSEQYTIQLLHRILASDFPTMRIEETTVNTNPIAFN